MSEVSAADLGHLYLELHHRFYRHVDEAMLSTGLSMSRAKVLAQLSEHGPIKQAALAAKLGLAGRSVTEAVDALERHSLAVRTVDPNDRRVWLIEITPAGADALSTAMAAKKQVMTQIFEALDGPARTDFARLLDSLRDGLTQNLGAKNVQH